MAGMVNTGQQEGDRGVAVGSVEQGDFSTSLRCARNDMAAVRHRCHVVQPVVMSSRAVLRGVKMISGTIDIDALSREISRPNAAHTIEE